MGFLIMRISAFKKNCKLLFHYKNYNKKNMTLSLEEAILAEKKMGIRTAKTSSTSRSTLTKRAKKTIQKTIQSQNFSKCSHHCFFILNSTFKWINGRHWLQNYHNSCIYLNFI